MSSVELADMKSVNLDYARNCNRRVGNVRTASGLERVNDPQRLITFCSKIF